MKRTSFLKEAFPETLALLQEKRLLLILVVILSFLFIEPRSAEARSTVLQSPQSSQSLGNPNCGNIGFNPQFDGVWDLQDYGWGARAFIGNYQVQNLCQASAIWSMTLNSNNPNASNSLAQVGYVRLSEWSLTQTYYFYEAENTTGFIGPQVLGIDNNNWGGKSDEFTAYYDSVGKIFYYLIDNTIQANTYLNWSPNMDEWFTEIHYPETNFNGQWVGDQVPGGYNHHTIMNNVQYLRDGAWHNINAQKDLNNDNPNAGEQVTNGNSLTVWDTRVS